MKNKIKSVHHYHFNYSDEINNMINELIAKRALKNKSKVEKISELLRNLIIENYNENN